MTKTSHRNSTSILYLQNLQNLFSAMGILTTLYCRQSIGPNLAEKIDLVKDASGDAVSYISGHYKNSTFLTSISPNEIYSIVSCLKSTSSSGYDEIPPSLINKSILELHDLYLIFLINPSHLVYFQIR